MDQRKVTEPHAGRWRMALIFLSGCLVTVLIGALTVFLTKKPEEKPKTMLRESVEYGDSFSAVDLLDCKGRTCSFPKGENEYALVFLLSASCRSCVEEVDAIGQLTSILEGRFADVVLLWQDDIPWDILGKTPIEETQNYSCAPAPLAGDVPRFYVLDPQATVTFIGKSMDELMQKFMALDGIEIEALQTAADAYMAEHFSGEMEEGLARVVEFSMVGCKDCEAAAPIVKEVQTQRRIPLKTIYCDKENVPEEKKSEVDHGNILAHIYGIRWYPSFVVMKENGRLIVGQTPEEKLKASLLQALGEG